MIEMDWRPNFAINRWWKRFESNANWILKIDKEYKKVAEAYWFKEIKIIEPIKKETKPIKKKTLKSKK